MKVGIIGGGVAGLVSAWLLEQEHEVVLFEQQHRLGGHAHTIYVDQNGESVPIEIGFEFFNERMFPYFCSLLNLLNIPTEPYPFTYTFFNNAGNPFILPPIQRHNIFWHDFKPTNISYLAQLAYLLQKGKNVIQEQNIQLTIESFLQSLRLTDSFKNNLFLPLFSAGWGITPDELRSLSAYNVLSWLIDNKPMGLQDSIWLEIPTGMSSYVEALAAQLTKSTIKTSTVIRDITYNNGHYNIHEQHGTAIEVDHLIIATNAIQANKLLQGIAHAQAVKEVLTTIEYIHATIAVHNDLRFMPTNKQDWSVANVWYNGHASTLTIHKPWKSDSPLLRSWLLPSFDKPANIIAQEHFYHAKPTPAYFKAQELIATQQGKNNVWLAGIYTNGIDAHESALLSGVQIATKLAPYGQRLQTLLRNL